MRKVKSKIKNLILKSFVAMCILTVFVSIALIESGKFAAVVPFALSILNLFVFAVANGYTDEE